MAGMTLLTAFQVTAAVATVAGTADAAAQRRKSSNLQMQAATLQNRRSQRQALREQQIRQSQMQVGAQALGASGGSGVAGGLSGLSSQLGSNLGYSGQLSGINNAITMANQAAANSQGIADFGGMAFKTLGGPAALQKWLKKP